MLINTPAGWRSVLGVPARPIREASSMDERRARMTDELAELCPSIGLRGASVAAAMLAATLAKMRV